MSSELLKQIAAGGEFDLAEAIREIAIMLTAGPIVVEGDVSAGDVVSAHRGQRGATTDLVEPRPGNKKK